MSVQKPLLVPLPTPFTDDTVTISEVRVARLVRHYKESGAAGFVLASEVGDSFSLSHSERKDLLEFVSRDAGGLPIIVNVTANTTASMLDLCQHAERHGARAAVYRPPATLGLTHEELDVLHRAFRRHSSLPVGLVATTDQIKASMGERAEHNWAQPAGFGDGSFPISSSPVTCEFYCADGVCTPLALFGIDRAHILFSRHTETRPVAEGIWKLAGPVRFAKAACKLLPFDITVGRSPIQEMNEANTDVVRKLWSSAKPL